jgi:hypothetical protein
MKDLPTKAGKVASMSLPVMLFGSSVLATEPNKDGGPKAAPLWEETSSLNWAKLSAEAHVAYVSSGWLPLAKRMIDADATTGFSFSDSDSQPTAIIELRRPLEVAEVGAFSIAPESVFDLVEPPSFVPSIVQMSNNSSPDFSNTLGTLANPLTTLPAIAPISP